LPEYFQSKLYSFQKQGIEFGIKNYGRVLIADEMVFSQSIGPLMIFRVLEKQFRRLGWHVFTRLIGLFLWLLHPL